MSGRQAASFDKMYVNHRSCANHTESFCFLWANGGGWLYSRFPKTDSHAKSSKDVVVIQI